MFVYKNLTVSSPRPFVTMCCIPTWDDSNVSTANTNWEIVVNLGFM